MNNLTIEEMLQAIAAPPIGIKKLPIALGGHSYVPWQAAYARMDAATECHWHYEIDRLSSEGVTIPNPDKPGKFIQKQYAVVQITLRIWSEAANGDYRVVHELAAVPFTEQAPPFEVATRIAVKRAMSVWGYGRDLWQGAESSEAAPEPRPKPSPPHKPAAPAQAASAALSPVQLAELAQEFTAKAKAMQEANAENKDRLALMTEASQFGLFYNREGNRFDPKPITARPRPEKSN